MIKYNFNKKAASVLTAVTISCTVWSAAPVLADTEAQKYTNTDFAMDTVVSETLYTTGEDINTEIGNKIREIETKYLSWTDENSLPLNDRMELYFEDFDIDGLLAKDESVRHFVRYAIGL